MNRCKERRKFLENFVDYQNLGAALKFEFKKGGFASYNYYTAIKRRPVERLHQMKKRKAALCQLICGLDLRCPREDLLYICTLAPSSRVISKLLAYLVKDANY